MEIELPSVISAFADSDDETNALDPAESAPSTTPTLATDSLPSAKTVLLVDVIEPNLTND
jgi:hypothetical protein